MFEVQDMFQSWNTPLSRTTVSKIGIYTKINSKMDAQSRNPSFNWNSTDLVVEWKAFRKHRKFAFRTPLRAKNEEKCCYPMLRERKEGKCLPHGTWLMQNRMLFRTTMTGSKPMSESKSNPVFARYKLRRKVQGHGVTCQQFVTVLKLLVKDCKCGQT